MWPFFQLSNKLIIKLSGRCEEHCYWLTVQKAAGGSAPVLMSWGVGVANVLLICLQLRWKSTWQVPFHSTVFLFARVDNSGDELSIFTNCARAHWDEPTAPLMSQLLVCLSAFLSLYVCLSVILCLPSFPSHLLLSVHLPFYPFVCLSVSLLLFDDWAFSATLRTLQENKHQSFPRPLRMSPAVSTKQTMLCATKANSPTASSSASLPSSPSSSSSSCQTAYHNLSSTQCNQTDMVTAVDLIWNPTIIQPK